MTQKEFELYCSKYVTDDKEVIEKLKKKSRKYQSKESIIRENNVNAVEQHKKDEKPKEKEKEDDNEKKK